MKYFTLVAWEECLCYVVGEKFENWEMKKKRTENREKIYCNAEIGEVIFIFFVFRTYVLQTAVNSAYSEYIWQKYALN